MFQSVLDNITQLADLGGPVVLLLVGISVITTAVILYKIWQLRVSRVGQHVALQKAVTAWDQGDVDAAHKHLAQSNSYLVPVIALGLDTSASADRLESEAEEKFAKLESGFRFLDSVAQVAPLLGLFGTVLGMINAFQALQEAGNQVDPSALAGGIWVALLTTAVGLGVTMPTSLILSWFEARMDAERVFAAKAIRTLVAPQAMVGVTGDQTSVA